MARRLERLRSYLKQHELEAIIVAKPENRFYFSGFTGSAGVLVITSGEALLITDFRYTEQAAKQAPDFSVVRHGPSLYATLGEELKRLGARKAACESDHITWDAFRELDKMVAELVPAHLDELRMQKDEDELRLVRQAVLLADNAFSHILQYLKPGVSERDIALELEYQMKKAGSERNAFDFIVASGARSAMPHGLASEKLLAAGDFVTMDFGAVFKGYHSDITRTVVIGKASSKQREIYDLVLKAQLAGVAAVAPGKCGREVDGVARDIIAAAGFGDYFGHGLGHGVGLAIHEEPRLSQSSGDVTLAPGMVVTVEPGVYLPEWGGVRIEDTVVVSATGVDVLTASSKQLIELDW